VAVVAVVAFVARRGSALPFSVCNSGFDHASLVMQLGRHRPLSPHALRPGGDD
jgi:hypothetical protein